VRLQPALEQGQRRHRGCGSKTGAPELNVVIVLAKVVV